MEPSIIKPERPQKFYWLVIWAIIGGPLLTGIAANVILRRRQIAGRRMYWLIGLIIMVAETILLLVVPLPPGLGRSIGYGFSLGTAMWMVRDIQARYFPLGQKPGGGSHSGLSS